MTFTKALEKAIDLAPTPDVADALRAYLPGDVTTQSGGAPIPPKKPPQEV